MKPYIRNILALGVTLFLLAWLAGYLSWHHLAGAPAFWGVVSLICLIGSVCFLVYAAGESGKFSS